MSKEIKEARTFTRKQVFIGLLPWTIIVVSVAVFVGYISGWTARGIQQDQVQAAASQMVTSLSKPASR
jgi:anti-sigma factor RsiW